MINKRVVLVVLDGFGIGAMDDVAKTRPQDVGANTCLQIFKSLPNFRLPALEKMGLGNALHVAGAPLARLPVKPSPSATFGVHRLAHFGADTFWGHQELMGTRPKQPYTAPFESVREAVHQALEAAGYRVRRYVPDHSVLIVNDALAIGDNVETDLGNNYNVTAALDLLPFSEVTKIGRIVRACATVSRTIVFGGTGVSLENLTSAFETKGVFSGISAPKSGVYRAGYQVVHLGYGVDPKTQLPHALSQAGIHTTLIGKVADIVENPEGVLQPCVDTHEVMQKTYDALQEGKSGFVCANVQETDLAGHRENTALYGETLKIADRGIARLMASMREEDLLIVTADHGNDPTIGHSQHTREMTPLLIYGKALAPACVGIRDSLADTAATIADVLGASAPQSGVSYLSQLSFKPQTQ